MSDLISYVEIEKELELRGYFLFSETETASVWKNAAGDAFDVLKEYDILPDHIKKLQMNKINSVPVIHPSNMKEAYSVTETGGFAF